jgi:hypothetical protein
MRDVAKQGQFSSTDRVRNSDCSGQFSPLHPGHSFFPIDLKISGQVQKKFCAQGFLKLFLNKFVKFFTYLYFFCNILLLAIKNNIFLHFFLLL